MTSGKYITYHAFYWRIAKNKFAKSILNAGGDIEMEANGSNHYLLKVSNPYSKMNDHPKWTSSNNKFWGLPKETILTIQPNSTKQ